jgi:hypothetical protein
VDDASAGARFSLKILIRSNRARQPLVIYTLRLATRAKYIFDRVPLLELLL